MIFEDRILRNPRLLRLKNPSTNEVINFEVQDYEASEIVQEGTEVNAEVMNTLIQNHVITDAYDPTKTYAIGDYCIYNNTLYRCTGATTGAWNSSKWSATSIEEELKDIQADVATNASDISTLQSSINWKLISTVTGTTSIALPSRWNEILIVSSVIGDTFKGLTCNIPYGAPDNINYRLSYYGSASDNANVGYYYGNNSIQLGWYNIDGSSINTSTVQTKVFYR